MCNRWKDLKWRYLVFKDWFFSILLSRSTDKMPGFLYLIKLIIWSLFIRVQYPYRWLMTTPESSPGNTYPHFTYTLRKLSKSNMPMPFSPERKKKNLSWHLNKGNWTDSQALQNLDSINEREKEVALLREKMVKSSLNNRDKSNRADCYSSIEGRSSKRKGYPFSFSSFHE